MRSIKEICKILDVFKAKDANPGTELEYKNAFTLLVAIVLSAQSTDKGVNKATKANSNHPQAQGDRGNSS